jgi:hypothetical protein
MGLARLIKWIGVVALVAGIIGFLLPGNFVYSPLVDSLLSKFGDALFNGISSNPTVKMFIAKAPSILLAVVGFGMAFWGSMKEFMETDKTTGTKSQDSKKSIKNLVDSHKPEEKNNPNFKSVKELVDRKKP